MAGGCFVVRAEMPDKATGAKFDEWYATRSHLPWALTGLGAQRGLAGLEPHRPLHTLCLLRIRPMSERRRR